MRAIRLSPDRGLELAEVPTPEEAAPGHLLVKIHACGINPGDKVLVAGGGGALPLGPDRICGVSGAGKVVAVGDGVPAAYRGKAVAIYSAIRSAQGLAGTWSEYVHIHHRCCLPLPDDVDPVDYSASLVNSLAASAFFAQAREEGHKGFIATAGNSATGRALLGMCLANEAPIVSIVRDAASREQLLELGAANVLLQSEPDFAAHLQQRAGQLRATAVFDGVGGALASQVAHMAPRGSCLHVYGFLGGDEPLSVPTKVILFNNLTIKGFGVFTSKRVSDPRSLEETLGDLGTRIAMPHFKTRVGRRYGLEDFESALAYSSPDGARAVLVASP